MFGKRKWTEDFYPDHVDPDQAKERRALKKLPVTRMTRQERQKLGPALLKAAERNKTSWPIRAWEDN